MKMTRRIAMLSAPAFAAVASVLWWRGASRAENLALEALMATPLAAPASPMSVFHIGHSLVNREMPAMLAQLAGADHQYHSQLGWGTTLKAHWGDDAINGFDEENAHPQFRAAHEAVQSGAYDAIVFTEMVEIRAALRYSDSPVYLAKWMEQAIAAKPDVRLYLYETWHQLDDAEGWLNRLDADWQRYWLDGVAKPALARLPAGTQLRLIPAGQVLAAFVRKVDAVGGIGNVATRNDLFSLTPEGAQDQIHMSDLGNYLVALVHYAVLYHRSPVGLPHALRLADNTPAIAPTPETALAMQETVLEVVRRIPITGAGI